MTVWENGNSVILQVWGTCHNCGVHTPLHTEIPPLLCPWPRTCRRSAACLHGVMLSFKQHVSRPVGGVLWWSPPHWLPTWGSAVACISMSGSTAGPLWGGQMWCLHRCVGPTPRGQTPSTPLVVLADPWLGKMEPLVLTFSQITGDKTWRDIARPLSGRKWFEDVSPAGELL